MICIQECLEEEKCRTFNFLWRSLSSFIRVVNDKRNQPIGINNNNNRPCTFVESVLAQYVLYYCYKPY